MSWIIMMMMITGELCHMTSKMILSGVKAELI